MDTVLLRSSADGPLPGWDGNALLRLLVLTVLVVGGNGLAAQVVQATTGSLSQRADHRLQARRFLAGRTTARGGTAAAALDAARRQHQAMVVERQVRLAGASLGSGEGSAARSPVANTQPASLSARWQAVGPAQVASLAYGAVTGRVTSIAIDPGDTTGNTVYVGTTGGGVWKSTNAAGPAASVSFVPLTDTLAAYSPKAGSPVKSASLSIGALSVAPGGSPGVVLAGTGDPNDATDSYYGVGILRSADGGLTWTLIQQSLDGAAGNHTFFGLGFAGFAWSTATSGLVVAALSDSAEGTIVNAEDAVNSVRGLYYSTDAGVTWQMATIMDGAQVVQQPLPTGQDAGGNAATAVVWNPERQMFIAAVRYHGYYQSTDGMTWSRMAAQPGSGLTAAACPTSPGTTGSVNCPIFRGALAVQPTTGDTFAFTVAANHADQGIWQDVCALAGSNCASPAVSFANRLNAAPLETSGAIPQGDYNLALSAVASGTDTLLFAGTVDLFRCSLAGGCVFRNTTNTENGCSSPAKVAPAEHAIATLANGGPLVFVGNDGGLWRSTDGVNQQGSPCAATDAAHFDNLNPALGSLAEVVSFAQHPTDANTLLVGLGANGTAGTAAATTDALWPQLASGEGGTVAIDPVTPTNWYISNGPGVTLNYCAGGASCLSAGFVGTPTVGNAQVANDAAVLDAPWLLDPAEPTSVVIGTCRVWRGPAENGGQWTAANLLSTELGSTLDASCTAANVLTRSLAVGGVASATGTVANRGSAVLYAGMAGTLDGGAGLAGHLFSTTTGGTDSGTTPWVDLATSLVVNDTADSEVFNPGGFDISSVVADPHDATGATVYATVMGFAGNGVNAPHVYRSTNGGGVWTNISSNLPGAPANAVLVDPNDANTVYVAMDTGVYVTTQV
ncbi:MAG: exo-alpha-sialidase, partial [Acidobacteria bacterium]|nr:exo-alpha-sialidase [Acidobacteriota bacterium]